MGPDKPGRLVLLPFSASWSIAIDTLKSSKTAMIGFGPSSYLEAFTLFRPADLNLSELWNLRFGSARNEPLNVLTTLGLFGFASWILFLLAAAKTSLPLRPEYRSMSIALLASIALQFFFPTNVVLTASTFLLLTSIVIVKKHLQTKDVSDILLHLFALQLIKPAAPEKVERQKASQIFSYIIAGILAVLIGVSVFYTGRAYAAEHLFYQSLVAAQQQDLEKTYRLQTQLLQKTPYVDTYHRSFASTNFIIARAISMNQQATEQEKANIAPLLQQAIVEAKTATTINPKNILNWEELAILYKELIPIAESADQWTIAAYVRAIQQEPTNPTLRFELASIYLGQKNYEQAVRLFQQAIDLKPDWANAYYNLGYSYQQKAENVFALQAYNQALTFLPQEAEGREQLQKDIEELTKVVEKQLSEEEKKQQLETQAQKTGNNANSSLPEGQIKIPEDLGLPEEEPPTTIPETPELEPTPLPTPSPSPSQEPPPIDPQ